VNFIKEVLRAISTYPSAWISCWHDENGTNLLTRAVENSSTKLWHCCVWRVCDICTAAAHTLISGAC